MADSSEVVGFPEFEDEVSQYARQSRPRTAQEAAEVDRLAKSRGQKDFPTEIDRVAKRSSSNKILSEVDRLARLHDEKSVNLPTSTGQARFSDNARVRHAHDILRNGA